MAEMICPGLPASWVNAWLAAVGATRLEPKLRLRWTLDNLPRAVLCADDADPAELLAAAWPTRRRLHELPIAETWGDTPPVPKEGLRRGLRHASKSGSFGRLIVDAIVHHD